MRKERKNRSKIAENRAITRRRSRKQSTPEISDELFVGNISINPNGFGFVKVLSEDENTPDKDWFVPAKYLAGAMHGDTVRIALMEPDKRFQDDKKPNQAAQVVEIIHRARKTIVGVMVSRDKVRPLDTRLPADILVRGNLHGA